MRNELVKYEKRGPAGTLTLDRPEALNAMSGEMVQEIIDALDEVREDPSVRLLVLTGSGNKAFCAGGDIAQMSAMGPDEAREYSRLGQLMTRKLETLPCATVAAVNGYALGGGTEIALACDMRVASTNAQFALPEVSLGIFPGFGGTQRLPRLVGMAHAKEIMFTAGRVNAQKALSIGLVNEVVAQEELIPRCLELAEAIARNSRNAVMLCKQSADTGIEMTLDQGLEQERVLFGDLFRHPDQREGTMAFVEKRKPNFEN